MLSCLKPLTTTTPPPPSHYFASPVSQGQYLENNSPRSSTVQSPIDLNQEFSLATQTNSYGEIRRTLDQGTSRYDTIRIEEEEEEEEPISIIEESPQLLDQVLRPSREFVQEAISIIGTNSLTSLISTYFEHSEDISRLCLLLHKSVRRVRALYKPIHDLLDDFFSEDDSYSLSQSQSMFAYNLFVKFDSQENPFLSSNSQCFNELRRSFSDLRQEFDSHIRKPQSRSSRTTLCSKGPALCLIAAALGVAISAVAIASHALVAILLSPMCLTVLPLNKTEKEEVNVSQLNTAAQGIYFLHKEIDTIDRVIAHLNAVVENDKLLIRLGLERGMDKYHIQEILRQLYRNRSSFVERLVHVEENLFLCFIAINRARALLIQEIHMQCHDS